MDSSEAKDEDHSKRSNLDHPTSKQQGDHDDPFPSSLEINGGFDWNVAQSPGIAPATNDVDQGKGEIQEMIKIVAKPSPEDDFVPAVAASSPSSSHHHRRNSSIDHIVAKIPDNYVAVTKSNNRSKSIDNIDLSNVQIDTAAPFESVKAAVSKFGGIVDWKAHRVQTVERRKFIEQELEKAQQELPSYKQQCVAAEDEKLQVLKRLDSTKRLIEELKLNLERAKTEEQQARQDSELVTLRVDEMERGIADESSFAAKAQLEVARARHTTAVSELENVTAELDQLKKDYAAMVAERDAAVTKAEEAVSSSKMVDKSVEELTIEIIALKQALESAHSEHLEAEEHRIGAIMAKEQETLNWRKEIKEAEEELERLDQQMQLRKELKSKLHNATEKLQDLKAELVAYMESTIEGNEQEQTFEYVIKEPEKRKRAEFKAAIAAANKELDEVKGKMERSRSEVRILKVAEASLKLELDKENSELATVQKREEMASIAVSSVENELQKVHSEIAAIRLKEQQERDEMIELPMQLQEAEKEAEEARKQAEEAQKLLQERRKEAEEAKAEAMEIKTKLLAATKEMEAAKASEKLALAAISALAESEAANGENSTTGVELSLEEYYELSKRTHEAEEEANCRVAAVMSEIEKAKESETRSLKKLEEVTREMCAKKSELEAACEKAEKSQQGKLAVEQELRKWRAEHEQQRKVNTIKSESRNFITVMHQRSSPGPGGCASNSEVGSVAENSTVAKKKKKSFFPRFFMFLGRRKSSSKNT